MAGSLIQMPANGAADWTDFVTISTYAQKSFLFVSITNFDNDSEPVIEDGSYAIVNGAMYKLTAAGSTESLTGWSGISNSSIVYMKIVPSGATCTCAYTTTAPTWSAAKGGWYDGNDLYFGGLMKGKAGQYSHKYIYGVNATNYKNIANLINDRIRIGSWNMDATDCSISKDLNIFLSAVDASKRFYNDCVSIVSDTASHPFYTKQNINGSNHYMSYNDSLTTGYSCRLTIVVSTAFFDDNNFDSTAINRGFYNVDYFDRQVT